MEKKIVLYMMLVGIFIFCVQSVSASTISVHPGDCIQSAIDKSSNGDTILVYDKNNAAYTYKESLYINKKIHLKSSGKVTIEAKNTSSAVVTVNSQGSGSSIQNFDMTQTNYCIVINNANSCYISGNKIKGTSLVGIQFYGDVSNSKVFYNQITGVDSRVGNGISFEYGYCSYNNVSGNTVSNFLNGILFNDRSECNSVENNILTCTGRSGVGIYATDNSRSMRIIGNTVSGAEDGIAVQQMGNSVATDYLINANKLNGNNNGMWIRLENSTVSNNLANSNILSGIDLTGRYNNILCNNASYNGICGITISGVCNDDYNVVSKNVLNHNMAGINSASQRSYYYKNTVSYNTKNGMIVTANHSSLTYNNINNNGGSGVLCIGLSNLIKSNQISKNNLGIYLQMASAADYNTVSYNNVYCNQNGINSASPYSQLCHNNVSSNTENGIINNAGHVSISSNMIKNNKCSGILSIGTYNSFTSNNISGNSMGICLQQASDADNNSIKSNSVTYNKNGVNSACSYSNFVYNTINNNNGTGVTITGSECNIYGNSLSYNKVAGLTITGSYNNVTQNSIYNNLYGASFSSALAAVFNFNRVVGNTYQLYQPSNEGTLLNAQFNWWGSNLRPVKVYGAFNFSRWLVLRLSTVKSQIAGTSSCVVADLNHDWQGKDVSSLGHVKNGFTIYFHSTLGTISSNAKTVNGTATTWFKAVNLGTANINTVLDSQKTPRSVSVYSAVRFINVAQNAINVSNTKTIQLTYSMPIKFGSKVSIELKSSSGKKISICPSIKSNVLTISHATLARGTKYALVIHTGTITDMNNKPMPLYSLSFTTAK
ncbi:parallel beta-helix repeat [Methanobacterium lacus]|uniref:Parallel beta-helix repeat n=1 Tax=Methanobacterium lacus (strain AL-21) TaxID=877455 RepID=F0TBQ3_METLA|nr:NosD domain-containing protein [Methanobacterium lacus]ADZ09130.1 parallel beta-helix repeat [Methanobacterium lacus]